MTEYFTLNITSYAHISVALGLNHLNNWDLTNLGSFHKIASLYEFLNGKIITREIYNRIFFDRSKKLFKRLGLSHIETPLNPTIHIILVFDESLYNISLREFGFYDFMVVEIPEEVIMLNNEKNESYKILIDFQK